MAVQTQIQVRRGTASSWTSTNPTLAAGEIGFETDTGKIKVGTGSSTWSALNYVGAANAIQYVYTASAGQTTFSGADNNSLTLSYTVGAEQVYVNGVLQVRGTDYTATNGTSVVLTTATIASDIVTVIAYGTFTVADTYTQAQANATFPLNTSAFFAGKNKIINGDFFVNQRNFSSSTSTDTYGFDRWRNSSSDGTVTYSAQTFTAGTAPVAGYEAKNYARVVTSGQTAAGALEIFYQPIEDVRTFAGQQVTYSFWAKAASGTPKIAIEVEQYFGTGGSPSATVDTYVSQVTLSTSWARYSVTFTMPSISGKTVGTTANTSSVAILMWLSAGTTFNARSGSLGIQSNTFDIWGVQLEAGSVATAFQTATGTIQGELAACQRYYYRATGSAYTTFGYGFNTSTTVATIYTELPVSMRVAPTTLETGGTIQINASGGQYTGSSFTIGASECSPKIAKMSLTISGATANQPAVLRAANDSTAYVGWSAEL